MKLTEDKKREVLQEVLERYFANASVEKMVLEYLAEASLEGRFATNAEICKYLEQEGHATSPGAVRGTILRIRHKLLKYRKQPNLQPYYLSFPEATPRGYRIYFERNSHYSTKKRESIIAQDPWLACNWEILRKQGYRGLWKGLSFPDGGRWPIKIYMWINSIYDEQQQEEFFSFQAKSPSTTRPRLGCLSGKIEKGVLRMKGSWSVCYQDCGIVHYQIESDMWPFRRSEEENVTLSGRFVIWEDNEVPYQEGQVELGFHPLEKISDEDKQSMFG